jgi:hypothetical protein
MKKIICVFMLSLLAVNLMAADGWYKGWGYRQKLTINYNYVSNNLVDFPILITETNIAAGLFTNALANGDDILFTATDGTTKLSHEIESYDAVNETMATWIKIPALSATTNTDVYVYYDNYAAANQEDVTNVWANGYVGVWHLNEQSGTNFDSTVSGNAAVPSGTVDMTATGQVAGADSFTGAGHLNVPTNETGLGMNTSSFTVSVWYKKISPTGSDMIIAGESNGGATAYRGFSIFATGTSLYGWFADSSLARRQVQVGGDVAGVWHHAALVRDKDAQTVSLYYQGEFKTSLSSVVGHTVTATQIDIGAANGGAQFNGSIDETRISLTARSAAWLVTEFNNQNDPVSFAVSSGEEMFTPTGTLIMVR